ncbi:Calmodulin-like protein [Melia azedarach]|uniref:Calmodulin-like protein n=1 Tax=Melia azedarach TaxID=155640 RepID=A0ACC1XCL9_MELAZ|nr:Calmodulin-like protein [Melia azedarach]
MVISILLLGVLFIAGFVNIFFYFPTKKFYAWIQAMFVRDRHLAVEATATAVAASNPQVSSSKSERRASYKKTELKRVFATFDKDGDGFITQKELRESLKNLRLTVSEKEAEEMVEKVDANGDGLIDFDEFCMPYEALMGVENHQQEGIVEEGGGEGDLKEAFDVFDKDKDGLISVEELGSVLSSLGLNEGKKIENCKEMIRKVDMDGDGMVSFDEFRRMMKAGGGLLTAF